MDGYAKFRTAEGCGWSTGTVYTGPQICGKPAKFTATTGTGAGFISEIVNRRVCGVHARTARNRGYTVEPIRGD